MCVIVIGILLVIVLVSITVINVAIVLFIIRIIIMAKLIISYIIYHNLLSRCSVGCNLVEGPGTFTEFELDHEEADSVANWAPMLD